MDDGENFFLRRQTQGVYRKELEGLQRGRKQFADFSELLSTIPEERREELTGVLRGVYDSSEKQILDPQKLQKLKERNPSLHSEVTNYYSDFLKKKLGV